MELWLAPLVLGIVGTLSFLVGLGFMMDVLRKRRLDTWLSQHGHRIQADIQGIEVNRAIKIQQRSPFQIICTWKDPRTERVHTFKSENFWKEPTELIQGRKTLDVLIKAEDPTEYLVDTHPFPER